MPTLYVQNVPEELYEALRNQAKQHGKSIAAEVVTLLKETVPTPSELKAREELLRRALRIRSQKPPGKGPFPSAEEMIREDRER
ncbi:MAG TPA: hypothetical protein VG206_17330 [Terriglobia bacterium]|nr:hypothetical protein [Terriglobia bacterium]